MYRAGQSIEDHCRVCKEPRDHRVIAVDGDGEIARVICGYCGSQHNFRGGGRRAPEPEPTGPENRVIKRAPTDERPADDDIRYEGDLMELEHLLRRIIREEAGLTPATPAKKWRGGKMVLVPGDPALQAKELPLEALFNKVVMIRNRLRVLEQHLNAAESLPDDQKLKLQGYITGCYGSLTTFNVLFADEDDKFKGAGGD